VHQALSLVPNAQNYSKVNLRSCDLPERGWAQPGISEPAACGWVPRRWVICHHSHVLSGRRIKRRCFHYLLLHLIPSLSKLLPTYPRTGLSKTHGPFPPDGDAWRPTNRENALTATGRSPLSGDDKLSSTQGLTMNFLILGITASDNLCEIGTTPLAVRNVYVHTKEG